MISFLYNNLKTNVSFYLSVLKSITFIKDLKINPLESWGRFQLYIKTPELQCVHANCI